MPFENAGKEKDVGLPYLVAKLRLGKMTEELQILAAQFCSKVPAELIFFAGTGNAEAHIGPPCCLSDYDWNSLVRTKRSGTQDRDPSVSNSRRIRGKIVPPIDPVIHGTGRNDAHLLAQKLPQISIVIEHGVGLLDMLQACRWIRSGIQPAGHNVTDESGPES